MPEAAQRRSARAALLHAESCRSHSENSGTTLIRHRLCQPAATPKSGQDSEQKRWHTGTALSLNAEQIHYLLRVLRLTPDDEIEVFDGRGQSFLARLTSVHTRCNSLLLTQALKPQAAPEFQLHLGVAMPKGDKLDFILQKSTELGVTCFVLLLSQRTEVRLKGQRLNTRILHWQKVIRSAAEQCGRQWLPDLLAPRTLPDFLQQVPKYFPTQEDPEAVGVGVGVEKILFHPGAEVLRAPPQPTHSLLLIGPEGGWSQEELELSAEAGFQICRLGRYVLRTETAAVAALSALQQGWGW